MEIQSKRVLVTGGAGFIGSHLVDALAQRDCQVRILDDLSTGSRQNLAHHQGNKKVELIEGSITHPEAVSRAIDGCEVVFHLACRGVRHSIGNPVANHDVNANGSLLLLGAAHRAKVKRYVHVSSSEVYGTARYAPMDEEHPCFPETVYGSGKLAGEASARAYHQTYGLPTVVVRPFNNFGPRSHFEGDAGEVIPRFVVWALNGKPPVIFGNGTQTRDFIYVEETAQWLCRVAEEDRLIGNTINLASGKETTVSELAKIVCEEAGRPDLKPVHKEPRPGDVHRHLACVKRAKELLRFQLQMDVRQGVKRLIAHLQKESHSPEELLAQLEEINWKKAG